MELLKLLLKLASGYKTYASTLVAIFSALALIFGGNYLQGVPMLWEALQAILVLSTGGAVASLRSAVAKSEAVRTFAVLALCLGTLGLATKPSVAHNVEVRSTHIDWNNHAGNLSLVGEMQNGRDEFYRGLGLPREKLVSMRCVPVVVNLNVDFRKQARLGDELRVSTKLLKLGTSSYSLSQDIRRGDEVIASAVVTLANYDPEAGKSWPVPDGMRRLLDPDGRCTNSP